jgi:thioredoxin-dependent peroxiredoxin
MSKPEVGDKAPQFKLPTDGGGSFSLSDQRGKPVVLFFYPKDDTSGCTLEALDFTAKKSEFDKAGIVLAGMSPDPVRMHDRFRDKHSLAVTLVSDESKTALEAYGVWKEKSMYGRKYMGVERSTFLIGPDGNVLRAWRNVKVPGHVDEVLAAAGESTGRN